ncbi:hypothetical protein [Archangium sp.]|uniref:hypothetical protein n=1 Tax=Archangium sp. TaxID=1872627 RepID=UPI002D41F208|nr:hypothetical protein [Archangium sp.]HYO57903.1 hypothetical protein [Archangium sp.]
MTMASLTAGRERLEATLSASAAALTAAHAELTAEDFVASPHPPSAQVCLADALLTQVEALQQSLRRYRTLVTMREVWARAAPLSEHVSSS